MDVPAVGVALGHARKESLRLSGHDHGIPRGADAAKFRPAIDWGQSGHGVCIPPSGTQLATDGWIALLYGLGVGLTFDEFGFWIDPPFVRGVRWNTNGLLLVIVTLAAAGLLVPLLVRRARAPEQSEVVAHTRAKPFPDPSV